MNVTGGTGNDDKSQGEEGDDDDIEENELSEVIIVTHSQPYSWTFKIIFCRI